MQKSAMSGTGTQGSYGRMLKRMVSDRAFRTTMSQKAMTSSCWDEVIVGVKMRLLQ